MTEKDGYFSVFDPIGMILANPGGAEVIQSLLKQVAAAFTKAGEQEDAQVTRQLLSNAAYVVNDNQTLEQIILEEAREYFSGARNAKEAAERIQSRASLYINEQM